MTFKPLAALFALVLMIGANPVFARGEKTWETASSVGAYGLAVVALGVPLIKKDKVGAVQAAGSMGVSELVTFGLKESFPELRPDGSNRKSFPSGHTSLAFSAAATIYDRQGAKVGIPALIVATFVGVARIKADKHHWYDCVAGAAIGAAAGFLVTNKPDRSMTLIPWGDTKGAGLTIVAQF